MKRQAITDKMKLNCLLYRHFIPCGICGAELFPSDVIEWDHVHALVHGGPHEYQNLRPMHAECHKKKTARDIAANAKIKRILADKPSRRPMQNSGRKIPSRPFAKAPSPNSPWTRRIQT
jgi:5-methylcytosine-specific restriction endonuclease McrA